MASLKHTEFTLLVPHYQGRLIKEKEGPYLATFTKQKGATSIEFSCLRHEFLFQTNRAQIPGRSRHLEDPKVLRTIGELLDEISTEVKVHDSESKVL
jgi:hypothetical protein